MNGEAFQNRRAGTAFRSFPLAILPGLILSLCAATPGHSASVDPAKGREILAKFVEVNRYWLTGPPPAVLNFSYVLQRIGGTQDFKITNPQAASRARLQGVTYAAMVHQLARNPQSANIRGITEEGMRVRLDLGLDPAVRGACGNGVENSWNGYHSLGGSDGYLVLDSRSWVPLEAGIGRLRETFGEFVTLDQQHYYPLAIRVKLDDTEYHWRFRLYEPGLWLFDDSHSGARRLAWVENVKVNSADAKLAFATTASLTRAESEKAAEATLRSFLKANGHWLLPSLESRSGLCYEYRQEAPYMERVIVAPEGALFVRLESSKDSPDRPTRQRLWLPDGRSCTGNADDPFVILSSNTAGNASQASGFHHDRMSQHLVMGLALDCALTRLAREPATFWAETRPIPNQPEKYLLVLHAKRDARLFTGTMLAFSSWSFMHDVDYDRSEVACDAATHRPLEEKDFSGSALKGHYFFENWLNGSPGAAPGRIRAVVPYEKDGKDQSLEMEARFRWTNNLWLLDEAESHFRGGDGGSTGKLTVLSATAESYAPIRDLMQKAEMTERILGTIQDAGESGSDIGVTIREWGLAPVKPAWTQKAREAYARGEDDDEPQKPALIGIHRARLVQEPGDSLAVELEGISTASWKEFETEWKISLRNQAGQISHTTATNVAVRAESAPAAFLVKLPLPRSAQETDRLFVQGTVLRMSGGYHGHGIWFHLVKED